MFNSLKSHYYDDKVVIPTLLKNVSDEYVQKGDKQSFFNAPEIDLSIYDKYVLCLSGGKDSIACLLALIEQGADLSKVELWHHDVDGREGSTLMDWSFMRDYNIQLAKHFNMPIYFSWLQGGFEGEMLKSNSYSKPHMVETPSGIITLERDKKRSKPNTRRKFPQVSASLQTRWCSSAVKIDVGRRAITNQERFNHSRTLFITGERRAESSNRAKYNQLEYHSQDVRHGSKGRVVDAWRPILHWSEEKVWEALAKFRIIAPVPYQLGWSRSSCMTCIYNDDIIWATIARYFHNRAVAIDDYEKEFGLTISREKLSVLERAKNAVPLDIDNKLLLKQAVSEEYFMPVALADGQHWEMPRGAFKNESCGAN